MRYNRLYLAVALIACLAGSIGALATSAAAQTQDDGIIEEKRPFDFADKYYRENGVDETRIVNRRTGLDKYSVFDYINSDIFRGVRILETRTGYDHKGRPVYWVFYGDLDKSAFTRDTAGKIAQENATRVAVFSFPSNKFRGTQRQSALIDNRSVAPEKNPLSLGMAVDIEFTAKAYSKDGRILVDEIIGKNGASLDGLPIIRTVGEIDQLTRYGLITQLARSISRPGMPLFTMARILENPTRGAISPDAFLEYTGVDGKPLDSEKAFVDNFECLQRAGKFCG